MVRVVGLDELIPDTPAGQRAIARRRAQQHAAGEASRAASAATLEQRQKLYAPKGAAKGWRQTNGAVAINHATVRGQAAGSWWLDVSREQFADRVAHEQGRMQGSRFGRDKATAVATEGDEA